MVRLGIIGCGAVTERHHLPALRRVRDIRVVALADEDRTRLLRLGRDDQARYTDWRELIQDHNVDAAAVCLPPQLHTDVALDALDHGKHLFIEKPLALSLADCDRLIEASGRHPSLKAMVGFNLRWHRLVREAREIIKRDELGEIRLVRALFTTGKSEAADARGWRSSSDTGGGVIFDLGVHHFDIVRFLLGRELEVVRHSAAGSDANATVTLSASSGAQVVCSFAHGTGENQMIEIYGARGWIRLSCYRTDGLERFRANEHPGAVGARVRAAANTLFSLPRALSQRSSGGESAASYVEEWNHFADAILRNKPAEADLLAGKRAVEIALAALEAR